MKSKSFWRCQIRSWKNVLQDVKDSKAPKTEIRRVETMLHRMELHVTNIENQV